MSRSTGHAVRPGRRVVALGGGHGLYASLSALRHLTDELTAVVTVADDGGSSGRLRRELGLLPPGDLRMALAALCDDSEWGRTWRDVIQHRFTGEGELAGHAVGNLLIASLWQLLDEPVAGLDWVARLLQAKGRVLPMCTQPLGIEADVQGWDGTVGLVRGQANVATAAGRILGVRLDPRTPAACPEAVAAVREADWVVLGPGSWFTSVLPHLLVPELAAALQETTARLCVVHNLLDASSAEGAGLSCADHLEVLAEHAPGLHVDAVLADPGSVEDLDAASAAAERLGGRLVLRQVGTAAGSGTHDPLRLAAALRDVLEGSWGDL